MAEGPAADLLAVAMVAVAALCAGRLVVGALVRRRSERDVDAVHVLMGVSMAGMLTGALPASWNPLWIATFGASSAWFAWRVARDLAGDPWAPSSGAHVTHLLGCGLMLYMLIAMGGAPMGRGMGAMAVGTGPGLGNWVLAALSLGIAVTAVLRTRLLPAAAPRPLAALGAHAAGAAPLRASAPAARRRAEGPATEARRGGPPRARQGAPLWPGTTPCCVVAMSVAMAYMLAKGRP